MIPTTGPKRTLPNDEITDLFKEKTASLNLASIELFKKLGIWEKVDQYSKEFTNIEVWDSEGSSAITFNAQDISKTSTFFVHLLT